MFCSKCGAQLPNDAKVCPSCGTPVAANNEINARDIANFAGNKAKDAFETIKSKTAEYGNELKQKSQEMQESMERQREQQREQKINDANNAVSNLLADPAEREISTLGGGYLRNFLSTGTLDKGFCTLTDKRVYFRGSCYYKSGNDYKASREERIVGLRDVTGTGFVEIRHWWLKLIAASFIILALVFFLLAFAAEEEAFIVLMLGSGVIAAAVILAYIFFKQKFFEISYAGGKIAFKASNYAVSEMQDFQKALHRAKDEQEKEYK